MPPRIRNADISVAARARFRRVELGLTQTGLASRIGVSFQQLQKYEQSKNRISAGILYELSKAFAVPVGYFFEDCEPSLKAQGRKRRAPKPGRRGPYKEKLQRKEDTNGGASL
jgi:transcriptional regulator with XRE-family HTH domain